MGKPIDTSKVAEIDEKTKKVFLKKGYHVKTAIGKGSYGDVYYGVRLKTCEDCAVKVMSLDRMDERFRQKFLPRELASLMEIRHENIIRVWDIFRSNHRIYIFMEFAANGELGSYIKKYGGLSEDRAHTWFTQILLALDYLHNEMFTAHRDIKIDNILLSDKWVAKLTDFGFATESADTEGNTVLSKTFCGTRPYFSPQLVLRQPYDPFKADIWACGVVLFAMVHVQFPFHFKDTKLMAQEQADSEFVATRLNRSLTKELKSLLLSLLEPDEEKRLSCTQVLDHVWILTRMQGQLSRFVKSAKSTRSQKSHKSI